MNLNVSRYLEAVHARFARHYTEAVAALLSSHATDNRVAAFDARRDLERVVAETMGIGEIIGAAWMLRTAAGVLVDERGTAMRANLGDLIRFRESADLLANVTFQEAIDDLVTRTPVYLRSAAERTAQRVSQLYGEGRVIAFARATEQSVAEKAQQIIAQAMREGIGEAGAGRLLAVSAQDVQQLGESWTESYARMAFRTNVNTAITAGRFRQAQDPEVRAVTPCFRFDAVGDVDTRDNHGAANGLVFRVDNPVWNRIAPPLGYNCRCQVSAVSTPMLRRMGRIDERGQIVEDRLPMGAFPDEGFRHSGRPDLFMVGAST